MESMHEEKNNRNNNRGHSRSHIGTRFDIPMEAKMNFLDELLKEAEEADEKKRIQMSKVRCDQVLQSIVILETKVEEVNTIAEHEQKIIAEWQQSENGKLERQIAWLARQCEEFIRTSGDKTIQLPHGRLSLRAGKAKVTIVDEAAFMLIAEKKGLVRTKPAEHLPDMLKIHEFIRINRFPPAGVSFTPATVNFSFKTKGEKENVEQPSEVGTTVEPADQAQTVEK